MPSAWGRVRRWGPVLALSLLVPAFAPWFEIVRRVIRDRLGEGYLDVLAGGLLLTGLAAFVGAVATIRRFRLLRYALLGVALALVGGQVLLWSGPRREVVLVERFHLVEYGLVAFLYVEALRHRTRDLTLPVAALLATAIVGLADEWVQWVTPVRTGELRDVLLNVWAGAIGVLFGLAIVPPERMTLRPTAGSIRVVRRLALVGVLVFGVVFDVVGHGVVIHDPVAGSFVSFHRPAELLDAREDRARRWAADPPPKLRPMAVEDYFRSEAGFHVARRNQAFDAGMLRRAWFENRILERWYTPFLRLPGHAWSAERRHRVAREARTHPAPRYRSPVLRHRLYTVPRAFWWLGVGAVLLALQLVGRALERRADGRGSAGKLAPRSPRGP